MAISHQNNRRVNLLLPVVGATLSGDILPKSSQGKPAPTRYNNHFMWRYITKMIAGQTCTHLV
ncbi:hypothetical protein, partial [Pseudoalteromonas piscicida]|uniref:hypothetical protein n=1 Tax=Pseudoalteromonas piscicida TaxID=43662 RepID=UPI001A90A9C1